MSDRRVVWDLSVKAGTQWWKCIESTVTQSETFSDLLTLCSWSWTVWSKHVYIQYLMHLGKQYGVQHGILLRQLLIALRISQRCITWGLCKFLCLLLTWDITKLGWHAVCFYMRQHFRYFLGFQVYAWSAYKESVTYWNHFPDLVQVFAKSKKQF